MSSSCSSRSSFAFLSRCSAFSRASSSRSESFACCFRWESKALSSARRAFASAYRISRIWCILISNLTLNSIPNKQYLLAFPFFFQRLETCFALRLSEHFGGSSEPIKLIRGKYHRMARRVVFWNPRINDNIKSKAVCDTDIYRPLYSVFKLSMFLYQLN